MSYWPPPPDVIRLNMSFELPAYFAVTLQPVCFSNGATHCFSVYPSQATSVSFALALPDRRRARRRSSTRPPPGRRARRRAPRAPRARSESASRSLLLDCELHVRAPVQPDAPALHAMDVLRPRLQVLLHAPSARRPRRARRRTSSPGRGRPWPGPTPGSPSAASSGGAGSSPGRTVNVRPSRSMMFDVPMNPATNSVAGCSYISAGVPICSIRPWLKTAMRSLIVSASSWSCVT